MRVVLAEGGLLPFLTVSADDYASTDLQRVAIVVCDDVVAVALRFLDVPNYLPDRVR